MRQAGRLLAACALAYGVAEAFSLPEAYWTLVTAAVVMQPDLKHTWSAGRDRAVATVIGAGVGLVLIFLRLRGLPTLPLFAAGLVPLALLTAMWPALRLSCATLVVVFLIPSAGDPYGRALFRMLDILLGVLACLAVSLVSVRGSASEPREPWPGG